MQFYFSPSLFVSLRLLTLIQFILALNWLMTTIVLKFQGLIFSLHSSALKNVPNSSNVKDVMGGLKVGIVSPEISCSNVVHGC